MSAIVVRSRDASGLPLTPEQRKTRAELVANRTNESKTLAGLQVEKASIEGQAKVAEVDLGPSLSGDAARRRRPGRLALVHPCRRVAARSRGSAPPPSCHPAVIDLSLMPPANFGDIDGSTAPSNGMTRLTVPTLI